MDNYLVVGGGGFIGSNIAEALVARGETVRVLDNFSTGNRENLQGILEKIDLMEGDITDLDCCRKAVGDIDFVVHHAAMASVPLSVESPEVSNEVNVNGTLNLLIASRENRIKRFVYAGSSSAYGNQPGAFKNEDMRPDPISPYGVSKLAGEYYLRAFSECYGLETVVLRYFNVFGPRQDPNSAYSAVIPLFIKAMLAGQPPVVHGDGLQSRDFTYIENNVRANILAATSEFEAKGQVYNIACGRSYNLLDLIRTLNAILGTDIEPRHTEARPGDVRDSKADISKAKADLGYEEVVSFEEGLSRTVDWYRSRLGN